jgi:hypothetical protein
VKRRLNPYLLAASLAIGGVVGWVGYVITNLSCRADQPVPAPGCPVAAAIVGVVFFIGGGFGMLVILGLTARSIAEYRSETQDNEPDAASDI